MGILETIRQETADPVHNVKSGLVVLAMMLYLTNSDIAAMVYEEGTVRNWDVKFSLWCLIFATIAQALSLSRSKMIRFVSGMSVAWFLSDMIMFIIPHDPKDVTERHLCDYMVMIAAFLIGCVHYHANTRLYNIISKWQKNK